MGDYYVVIKLWEKVLLLDEKIPIFLVIVSLYFQERVFAGQLRIEDDAIMNQ